MILDRRQALILAEPLLAVPRHRPREKPRHLDAFKTPSRRLPTRGLFSRFVSLQISKIATILRWIQLGESLHPTQKSYRAGSITLQLVRPDITQSCSWLADLRSRASQIPTPSRTTAMIRPAMAPRRLSPWSSGSGIGRFTSIEAQVALLS
jgi:hypothetical protein